mmetsp:Transcript_75582/g.122045  ORF Transcript_75582/g.122045 Transcript_75582/m.122045 type:complete len:228 (-) Transcript_75582:81-764(-)
MEQFACFLRRLLLRLPRGCALLPLQGRRHLSLAPLEIRLLPLLLLLLRDHGGVLLWVLGLVPLELHALLLLLGVHVLHLHALDGVAPGCLALRLPLLLLLVVSLGHAQLVRDRLCLFGFHRHCPGHHRRALLRELLVSAPPLGQAWDRFLREEVLVAELLDLLGAGFVQGHEVRAARGDLCGLLMLLGILEAASELRCGRFRARRCDLCLTGVASQRHAEKCRPDQH